MGDTVAERMGATKGVLVLLRALAEGPRTREGLLDVLQDSGLRRDARTIRRWFEVLREAGFHIERDGRTYELRGAPVRLAFGEYEALATLSVLDSLAARDPVYGEYLTSAATKLRKALPEKSLKFADGGRIEFALDSVSDPPEDPVVLDTLRRATRQSRCVEILYYSLNSKTVRWRLVEPVRVYYAQSALRLDAYEREKNRVNEFRINRIREAKMLHDKFSSEAHRETLDIVEVRLSETAFLALGKTVVPDPKATVERLQDGGAIVTGATPNTFWTLRELFAMGPEAEVLGGPKFKQEFLDFLHKTLEKYR